MRSAKDVMLCDHSLGEPEAAATAPRSASPFSNCGPHILSQSMNNLIALPMRLFLPYIAHVTVAIPTAHGTHARLRAAVGILDVGVKLHEGIPNGKLVVVVDMLE